MERWKRQRATRSPAASAGLCGRRGLVLLVGLTVLATAAPVLAASVTSTSSKKLGAGTASIAACGSLSAASVSYQVQAGAVRALTVSGLPSSCNGGQLSATLNVSGTDGGHGGPVTVSSGAATVSTLSANPSASTVTDVRISIQGP